MTGFGSLLIPCTALKDQCNIQYDIFSFITWGWLSVSKELINDRLAPFGWRECWLFYVKAVKWLR